MFRARKDLLCSNCGYENPRGHRFCGMCGTPFPLRSITVPSAQSTLSFTSTPLEITATMKPEAVIPGAPEPPRPGQITTEIPRFEITQVMPLPTGRETHEPEKITQAPSKLEPSVVNQALAQDSGAVLSRPLPEQAREPQNIEPQVSAQTLQVIPPPEPPQVPGRFTEAAIGTVETEANEVPEPALEVEPSRVTEAGTLVESKEPPTPVHQPDTPPPPRVLDPETAEKPPLKEPESPPAPPPSEPQQKVPVVREPTSQPKPETEIPFKPQPVPEKAELPRRPPLTTPPLPVRTPRPAPRVAVVPQGTSVMTASPVKPPVNHRSPDSLPITPPPDSAGMPTFQQVVDAAGAPPLSPFEQLAQTPAGEDEELKQFVANFRYTPPEETADELTMRSEVPVVDKEVPAEFHHPSFDGDEPPPEEEPHPTGQEYYPPPGEATRSRFLEIDERTHGAKKIHEAKKKDAPRPGSLLGLDDRVTVPAEDIAPIRYSRWWLWTSLVVLFAIFATWGFFVGRAQSTDAFSAPLGWVRLEYSIWSDKLIEKLRTQKPENPPPATANQTAPETIPDSSPNQGTAQPSSQSDASNQPAAGQAEDTAPATQETSPQPQSPPAANTEPATTGVDHAPAARIPEAPIQPPPAVQSSRPQPGQQELNKALSASDATAAAAWLWKATSRGNPEAPVRLADMYIKGNGVPRSCEQALVLLRSAAMKENAPARNRLAALYANGTCVARDKVKAYQLMSSALQADPNSEWAKENRQEVWNQMTPSERAMAQKYR